MVDDDILGMVESLEAYVESNMANLSIVLGRLKIIKQKLKKEVENGK